MEREKSKVEHRLGEELVIEPDLTAKDNLVIRFRDAFIFIALQCARKSALRRQSWHRGVKGHPVRTLAFVVLFQLSVSVQVALSVPPGIWLC